MGSGAAQPSEVGAGHLPGVGRKNGIVASEEDRQL